MGERLQYARLTSPTQQDSTVSGAPSGPPVDDDGLPCDIDPLTLAGAGNRTGHASEVAPGPALEAELDGFTALLARPHRADSTDLPAADNLEESQ